MKLKYFTAMLAILLSGCQSVPIPPKDVDKEPTVEVFKQNISADMSEKRAYPQVTYAKMSVPVGAQTLTAANKLADELGVEFVEWTRELNPYEYFQLRSKRISLDYDNPQNSFIELFDRSGLLAHYDRTTNAVTIYPFSMDMRVTTPHIFTPKFERSEKQSLAINANHQSDLVKLNKAIEYHYYAGYSVKETINAWANQAGHKGVIWYLNDTRHIQFANSIIEKSDSTIAPTPLAVMSSFLKDEMERKNRTESPLSLSLDQSKQILIVHTFAVNEMVKAFDIEATTVKVNLQKVANFYGYTLDYRTTDYAVPTPYTTVLSSFVEQSIKTIISQYPLNIEVIDSTKRIIVRGKNNA
ncbi:hypothetical protein NTH44_003113 [Vibrio metoecus]